MNKKIQSIISEKEKEVSQKVGPSRDALAAARTEVPVRERQVQDAIDAEAAMRASFKAREDKFTALDYATAQAETIRADLALAGASVSLERATRALLSDDKSLATLMARPVLQALPGVEVIPTFVDHQDKPQGVTPVCLVVQHDEASISAAGNVSGDVTLRFHHGPIHRELDADAVLTAAERMGYLVDTIGGVRTSPSVDTLKLRVRSAFTETPLIAEVDENQAQTLGRAFAQDLAQAIRYEGYGCSTNSRSGLVESSHIVAFPHGVSVVANDVDATGKRTLTIDSSVLVRIKTPLTGRRTDDVVDNVIETQGGGKFYPSLGVAVACEQVYDSELEVSDTAVTVTLDRVTNTPTDANVLAGYLANADRQTVTRTTLVSNAPASLLTAA